MTVRGGGGPRRVGRSGQAGDDGRARHILDTGWDDDGNPNDDVPNGVAGTVSLGQLAYERRRGRPNQVARFAVFALVLGAVVVGGLFLFVRPLAAGAITNWAAENSTALKVPFVADIVRGELGTSLTQPVDAKDRTAVQFRVAPGQTPREIGAALASAGLIKDSRAFVFASIEDGVATDFVAGNHTLTRAMTVNQIAAALATNPPPPPMVKLTFREGLRIEQMVAYMEYQEAHPADSAHPLKLDVAQFYQLATHPPAALVAKYPWLKLPEGASLEGFLFPATYTVSPDVTAQDLITLLLDAFASHAPPALLQLPPEQIYQKVTLASLVEPETPSNVDRPLVAGVYVNRLDPKKWPTGLLNSNPSVTYAQDSVWLESHPIASWVDYTFWVEKQGGVSFSQLNLPANLAGYNTYRHGGLPPTPILSPSLSSLEAALAPDTKDGYYYFLATPDGTVVFARTNAEQVANEKKYGLLP